LLRNPVLEINTKPIECSLTVPNRYVLFLADIPACQVEQFAQRLIAWKWSPVIRKLAQAHVHGFDGTGRVDHFPNFRRIVKQRNDALPITKPALQNTCRVANFTKRAMRVWSTHSPMSCTRL